MRTRDSPKCQRCTFHQPSKNHKLFKIQENYFQVIQKGGVSRTNSAKSKMYLQFRHSFSICTWPHALHHQPASQLTPAMHEPNRELVPHHMQFRSFAQNFRLNIFFHTHIAVPLSVFNGLLSTMQQLQSYDTTAAVA